MTETPTLLELVARRAADGSHAWVESARDDRTIEYAGLPALVQRWRNRLDDAGLVRGSRVGLRGADPVAFAAAWLGIVASGRVVAPLAPDAPPDRVRRWQDLVRPVALVDAAAGPDPEIARMPASAEPDDRDASPDGDSGPHRDGDPLGDGGPHGDGGCHRDAAGGVLLSSSGTTGTPKLVRLTEAQLLHTASAIASHHRLGPDDRGLNPLPLFHINAEVVGLLSALVAGATVVLDDRFHRSGFWSLVRDRDITWVNAVPAILAVLAQDQPDPRPPATLRFARSASAPLPPSVQDAFERATGVPVVQTYGMTEAGSQITANDVDGERPRGSVGRPVGVDLRVVDDTRAPVAPGTVGRVQIRGAGVVTSYAGVAGGDRFTPDGWLDTGDLGHLDAQGRLYLAGRTDDVINRSGEKIFPTEVEDLLRGEPDVREAVVVAWPDAVLGEVPVAAVVAEPADEADLVERLERRCVDALPRTHRPTAFHVLGRLPTGVNGKISRRQVRAALSEGAAGTVR